MATHTWSDEQNAIFDWFANGGELAYSNNLVVVARAGCGKTTTILEGVKRAPETRKFVGAFGNKIARELKTKFYGQPYAFGYQAEKAVDADLQAKYGVKIQTFHSLGMGYVMSRWHGVRVDNGSERADALTKQVTNAMVPDDCRKAVSKLHTKAREIAPHAIKAEELESLCAQFECEPDEQWQHEGYDAAWVCQRAIEAMDVAANNKPDMIDFADMIFLPVRNGWMRPRFDLVVVDEAQDLTVAQLELALGSLAPGGRACVVGDDRQAIYAFRGADCESLSRLKAELHAAELGLKTTYRCAQLIVDEAQKIVPDFRADVGNPDGHIIDLCYENLLSRVDYGDFVLSRANAPLLPTAMALLRQGRRARIAGRDIGKGLKSLIAKLAKGSAANSVPAFISRLGVWRDKELARARSIASDVTRKAKQDYVHDQHDMLLELADGAVSVPAIGTAIDALFTDDGLGDAGVVTLSSVHRAKGLEANRVFILAETIREDSEEELNIKYVAITRAKRELVWVYANDDMATVRQIREER